MKILSEHLKASLKSMKYRYKIMNLIRLKRKRKIYSLLSSVIGDTVFFKKNNLIIICIFFPS